MCDLFEPSEVTNKSSSTTTVGPDKRYQDVYSRILRNAQTLAQQKYDPATESRVADFTSPQTQAFSQVQSNQGVYLPYLNDASALAARGSAAITPDQINQYMDPYLQNVVNATQQQFSTQNDRQLMDVRAQAARAGALGGSGRQVAEALTREAQANAQNPVIAGLYSQGYNQALGAAQTDANRALQGSQVTSGLGGLAQQYGYNDVHGLLGIGGMQQGLQQQQYDTATANAQQRAAFPYQNLQWLSGIASGLGGAAGSTQTTTGTQTTPGPSLGQQLIGGGIAAAGLFMSNGGRVGYDDGGVVRPYGGAQSYIPQIGMSPAREAPTPSLAQASGTPPSSNGMGDLLSSYKQAHSALSGLDKLGQKMRTTTDPASGFSTTVNPSGVSGWGNYLGNMFSGMGFSHGGGVGRLGYADGGDVLDLYDDGTGAYGVESFPEDEDLFGNMSWDEVDGPNYSTSVPLDGSDMAGVAPVASVPAPTGVAAPVTTPEAAEQGGGLFGWSDATRQALVNAGLGIMASKSPNVGVALGEGGLMGMKSYQDAQDSAAKKSIARERIAQSAAALQERARIAAETLKVRQSQADALIPYRQAQMENMQSLIEARNRNAAMRKQIMDMLGGGGEEGVDLPPAATGDNPVLQPQSFDGSGPMPGVILASDDQAEDERADAAAAAPSAEADVAGSAPGAVSVNDNMIDTPYGRMTRHKAMKLGGAMMLDPQYAQAGKSLVELAQTKSDPGLAKPTVNQLEERTLNSAAQLARLQDIDKRFRPEWLEIPKRFEMLGASWSAKAGEALGGKLAPEKTQELREYASFRSASVNNLNTILKELSGAAVTPQEYERIQNDQPVAGTGIFDGDDPISFRAKLDRTRDTLKAAIARYNFMRSKGLNFDKNSMDQFMALEDVPGAINQRGAEIEQQILKQMPKADKSVIQKRVDQQLKREFGI